MRRRRGAWYDAAAAFDRPWTSRWAVDVLPAVTACVDNQR